MLLAFIPLNEDEENTTNTVYTVLGIESYISRLYNVLCLDRRSIKNVNFKLYRNR